MSIIPLKEFKLNKLTHHHVGVVVEDVLYFLRHGPPLAQSKEHVVTPQPALLYL